MSLRFPFPDINKRNQKWKKSMERLLNKTKIVVSFTRASIGLAFALFVLCKPVNGLGWVIAADVALWLSGFSVALGIMRIVVYRAVKKSLGL